MTAAVTMAMLAATPTSAAVTAYLYEDAGNVVAEASGSLDLTGLTYGGQVGPDNAFAVNPSTGYIRFNNAAGDFYDLGAALAVFGTGASTLQLGTVTGDTLGIQPGFLIVPRNYLSGTALSSQATLTGQTLLGIGAVAGTYVTTLPNDTYTLIVGNGPNGPSDVPLPAGLVLLLSGFGAFWALHRRS